jgi:hypothetical protein
MLLELFCNAPAATLHHPRTTRRDYGHEKIDAGTVRSRARWTSSGSRQKNEV